MKLAAWLPDDEALEPPGFGAVRPPRSVLAPGELPPAVAAALWRGHQLGAPVSGTVPTGWQALDAELPGGGWPRHAVTEIFQAQSGIGEWRLLADAPRTVFSVGRTVVVVGPTRSPHLPGLQRLGLDEMGFPMVLSVECARPLSATSTRLRASLACSIRRVTTGVVEPARRETSVSRSDRVAHARRHAAVRHLQGLPGLVAGGVGAADAGSLA